MCGMTSGSYSCTQGTLERDAGIVGGKHLIGSTGAFVPKTGDCGSEWAWIYLVGLVAVCRICIGVSLPLFERARVCECENEGVNLARKCDCAFAVRMRVLASVRARVHECA